MERLEKYLTDLLNERSARFTELLAELDRRYEQRFAEMDRRYQERFAAQERAVAVGLTAVKEAGVERAGAIEKRLEGMNEFRGAMTDAGNKAVPRPEYTAAIGTLTAQIAELKARLDVAGGRSAGLSSGWGLLVAAVGLALAILAFWRR